MPLFKLQKLGTTVSYGAIVLRKSAAVPFFIVEDAPFEVSFSIIKQLPSLFVEALHEGVLCIPAPVLFFTVDTNPQVTSIVIQKEVPRFYFHVIVEEFSYMWIKPKPKPLVNFEVYVPVLVSMGTSVFPSIKIGAFRAERVSLFISKKIGNIIFKTELQEYASLSIRANVPSFNIDTYSVETIALLVEASKPGIMIRAISTSEESALIISASAPRIAITAEHQECISINFNTGSPGVKINATMAQRCDILISILTCILIKCDHQESISLSLEAIQPVLKFYINSNVCHFGIKIQTSSVCIMFLFIESTDSIDACPVVRYDYSEQQLVNNNSVDPDTTSDILSFGY